jgi:glyoxylase-like metal-dependent hydrolase (beta-lactamase superfamily II)
MSNVIKPEVTVFFEKNTFTVTAVVRDPHSKKVAVVDSVLDFDYASGRTSTASADEVIAFIKDNNFEVEWILETHAHADHLSAAPYIKEQLGGTIAIGEHIKTVQGVFADVFNEGESFKRDGSQFDVLFKEGDTFKIGDLCASVMHTPGHTPACVTYHIGDALFVGDTLFMPDFGSARCDFPGGSADTLYSSVQRLLELPPETRMFVGHDYLPKNGRNEYVWETTVGAQREHNIHIGGGTSKEDFVKMRTERDATLAMPRLILPSIQVNIRAGHMPEADEKGRVYLKVPVDLL